MADAKPYKLGDPCPGCGGDLRKAPQMTQAMRRADRTSMYWVPPPPHYDTATLEQIAELGELYRCLTCGYPHREKPAAEAAAT